MTLPKLQDWIFSLKTFAAGMLSLYLGFALSVPRPYWALATVYICSNPLSGATRSKSAYRVLGTFIGASAAVVMVPNLVGAPQLLVLALALWIGLCLYLSLLDRSPRSYVFMLGGYTAALIGFPAVNDPGSIFDLAVARVEAITLGVVCASLVSGLVFPRSVGVIVAARAERWLADAARFGRDALAARPVEADLARLAGDVAELDALSIHAAFDGSRHTGEVATLATLRVRMLMAIPVLSSIADRLAALRDGPLPPDVEAIVGRLSGWIGPGGAPDDAVERLAATQEADALRTEVEKAERRLSSASTWREMLLASLLVRLREFLDIAEDCRSLRSALSSGRRAGGALRCTAEAGSKRARHVDHLLPLMSAVGVVLAVVVTSAFWILSGWPDGASAPMLAAVAACFFASKDDPAPSMVEFTVWSAVAVVVVTFCQFVVLPYASSFEMVVLGLAPVFVACGVMMAMPGTSLKGLAIAANGSTLLALQGSYNADFASHVNGGAALVLGMVAAAVLTQITRSVGAEFSIRRLVRADAVTLARAARGRGRGDRADVARLMLDRLGLVGSRIGALPVGSGLVIADAVAAPRVGLNVVDLRRSRHGLDAGARRAVDQVLDRLAVQYGASRYGDSADRAAPTLLGDIDAALLAATDDGTAGEPTDAGGLERAPAWRDAVLGLVGLRRALFPAAEAYRASAARNPQLQVAAE